MHALDYLQGLDGKTRARIALDADVTPSYVTRLLCMRENSNYVSLSLAIAADKHSGGQVDVLGSLKETGTDWKYLRDYLNTKL
jgi:hypothetical protein